MLPYTEGSMDFTQEMIDSLVVDVGEAVDTSGLRFIDLFAKDRRDATTLRRE